MTQRLVGFKSLTLDMFGGSFDVDKRRRRDPLCVIVPEEFFCTKLPAAVGNDNHILVRFEIVRYVVHLPPSCGKHRRMVLSPIKEIDGDR